MIIITDKCFVCQKTPSFHVHCSPPPPHHLHYRAGQQHHGRGMRTWGTALLLALSVLVLRKPITVFTKSPFCFRTTVYKLKIGAQKKSALSILPAFGEHGQEDVSVTDVRGSSLVWQEIQDFPSGPLPCCSHFVAGAENVLKCHLINDSSLHW